MFTKGEWHWGVVDYLVLTKTCTQVESSKFTEPLVTCAGHLVKTNSVQHQKYKEIYEIKSGQTRTFNLEVGSGAMEELSNFMLYDEKASLLGLSTNRASRNATIAAINFFLEDSVG